MGGFLSKLTGGSSRDDENDFEKVEEFETNIDYVLNDYDNLEKEINLEVDAYEDDEYIYIKAFIPGIKPRDLDIDISRDTVSISGERFEAEEKEENQYFKRELSWGKFKKIISLPKEIDIENIQASGSHGVLTLKLPKIDKDRKVKIKLD